MGHKPYYTLLASLPPLPRFDRAKRLPISRERLQQRLRMLDSDDARVLERVAAFLARQKEMQSLTDREMANRFEKMSQSVLNPTLRALLDFPLNQRTVMVALRRRHLGFDPPTGKEPGGLAHT